MVLGDEEDEAAALSAAMRFSRRQRKMDVDEDLAADQAVEMQEERAAQQRCAFRDLFLCPSVAGETTSNKGLCEPAVHECVGQNSACFWSSLLRAHLNCSWEWSFL
jgi:hypothetical protein